MVHLAYMTEWIHNPGQFKIPWGPVGIKWNHISKKEKEKKKNTLPHCHLQQLAIQLFPFHVVDERGLLPRPDGWANNVYQLNAASDDL